MEQDQVIVESNYEAPEFVVIDLVDSIGDICGSGGGGGGFAL